MLDFMRAGGFLMWPLLGLGLVAVAAATRRSIIGDELDDRPARLARAVLAGALGWSALGLVMVTRWSGMAAGLAGDPPVSALIVGVGEALCPTVLGLMTYALTSLISTLPRRREPMAARVG